MNTRDDPPRSSWVHPLGAPPPSGYAPPPGAPPGDRSWGGPSPYGQGPPGGYGGGYDQGPQRSPYGGYGGPPPGGYGGGGPPPGQWGYQQEQRGESTTVGPGSYTREEWSKSTSMSVSSGWFGSSAPPQTVQVVEERPAHKSGPGMGTALLAGMLNIFRLNLFHHSLMGSQFIGGAGLIGGALLADAWEDHDQAEQEEGYQEGEHLSVLIRCAVQSVLIARSVA